MLYHAHRNLTTPKIFGLLLLIILCVPLYGSLSKAEAGETVNLPTQTVAPGDASLTVNLQLPAGHKLNQEAPSTLGIRSGDNKVLSLDEKYAQNLPVANLPLCLTVPATEGKTDLKATFRLNFCDEKLGVCFLKEVLLNLPVEVKKTSTNKKLDIMYQLKSN